MSSFEKKRVLVAMSGGVDSAVAAARLHDAGHEVVGCTLHLWDYADDGGQEAHGRCCAPEDQYDARRTADFLGFAHYTFDRRELFASTVVAPFVEAYLAGETPSPCTTCNRGVKLTELFAIADRLGATEIATGHYARIERDKNGTPWLLTGKDPRKDQSYFLYATPPAQLNRLVFPLGESAKEEVRAEAVTRNLPGATKGESQELCFVGAGAHAYASFVEKRSQGRARPGPIVDDTGRVVGQHDGFHRFTVGQRKGIGLALGKPAFVTKIDAANATVHVGGEDDLLTAETFVDDLVLSNSVTLPLEARVRVRYRHDGAAAKITAHPRGAKIAFDAEVRAVTSGQVAVFYEGDRVLGGGRIVPAAPAAHDASAAAEQAANASAKDYAPLS